MTQDAPHHFLLLTILIKTIPIGHLHLLPPSLILQIQIQLLIKQIALFKPTFPAKTHALLKLPFHGLFQKIAQKTQNYQNLNLNRYHLLMQPKLQTCLSL